MTGPGPGGQNWNWHPEGLPPHLQPPMPGAPMPGSGAPPPAPVDVETARHLWSATVGLGVFLLVLQIWTLYQNRSQFLAEFAAQLRTQQGGDTLSAETLDNIYLGALVFTFVLGAGFTLLVWWMVGRMRGGAQWARVLLTVVGVFAAVIAIPRVFAVGASEDIAGLVDAVLSIVQGVTAAGATYMMYRPDATAWFTRVSGPPGHM